MNKKKESTYQKYKRERKILLSILDADVVDFVASYNHKEFKKRLAYLKGCMKKYRSKNIIHCLIIAEKGESMQ